MKIPNNQIKQSIYLDYAATTPVDERVIDKMINCMKIPGVFGNSNSTTHEFGREAQHLIGETREKVAQLFGVEARTIIWTSGATEANNLALQGVAHFYQAKGKHIISCLTEHPSVLETCRELEQQGFEVTYLKPDTYGRLSIEQINSFIRKDTILVSIMHVNNETGVIQDIEAIGDLCRSKQIFFHVDAAQSAGKIPINLNKISIDLMSLSAHKVYGPKGIGALYIGNWPRVRLVPILFGGGQERGFRPGTLATHQIVGMAEAYQIASETMSEENIRIQSLRNKLWEGIKDLKGIRLNGHPQYHISGILNICFSDCEPETLLKGLSELAISSASACHAATTEPSHVLRAMGLSDKEAHRSFRFSLGRYTTSSEIERTVVCIRNLISA